MKKYLALVLGVVFVLGFAASAFAIHADIPAETQAVVAKGATQISIGGEIRFRGDYQNNNSDFNSDKSDHKSYYDSRIRLSVDAQVTPNTEGFVQIEAGSDVDGNQSSDLFIWGNSSKNLQTGSSNSAGIYNQGDSKRGTLSILQAWIINKGNALGIPAGIKIGHMPLALGNSIFFDHTKYGDDAIVLFADPVKEMHIAVLTAKFREGATTLNDDADAYVGLLTYQFDKNSGISGDITYVNDQTGIGTVGAENAIHFWNFGLRGNTAFSGFGLMADAEFQAGDVKNTATANHGDVKFGGWAFKVGGNYKLDPVTLSLDWAWGSGDDNAGDAKVKAFVTSQSAIQHFTYVYDYRTKNACGNQYGGLCNTMYVKLGANADLTKDLNGDLGIYYLHADKKFNGVAGLAGVNTDSKDIGWEIDASLKYKIDRNLNYWVEGGYLFAGDFWKSVTPAGKSPDNAYSVRHGISLSF